MYCPWIEPNHWNVIVQVKHDFLRFTNQCHVSEDKIVNELSSVMEMFQSFKKSCRSATLTMSAWEGKSTKVKLEAELDDATQSSAWPSPTSTSANVEVSRKILTVKKPAGCPPTFATLNLDGASPPSPAPPSSMWPPPCSYKCAEKRFDHCQDCGKCAILCPERILFYGPNTNTNIIRNQNLDRIRIRIIFVSSKWANTNTNNIRAQIFGRIRIRIIFGFRIVPEYEYE